MAKVTIKFSETGEDEITVEGVPGGDCRNASKPYLDAIGGEIVQDKPTAEMFEPPNNEHLGLEQ